MTRALPANGPSLLTDSEEITLRRVAYGQSAVAHLRADDLERLRALKLIDANPGVLALTAAGRVRFDALAKPVAITEFNMQNELIAVLGRLMAKKAAR